MAIEKEININVNVGNSTSKIDKLNKGFSTLKTNTKEVTSSLGDSSNAILENGGAMGLLNDATGGVAMTIKDAVEATWLFTKGTTFATATQKIYTLVVGTTTGALKALRIALVSTGLGAIVVALGFLIAKMNEATEATEAQTRAQDALNKSLDATNNLYKESIKDLEDVTKERILRAKIAGKSEQDLMKIEKEADDERYQNYINERERLLQQLSDKNLNAEGQEKVNKALAENQREYFSFVQGQRIKDLEDELSNKEERKKLAEKEAEERKKRIEEQQKEDEERWKKYAQGLKEARDRELEEERSFSESIRELRKENKEHEDEQFLNFIKADEDRRRIELKSREAFEDAKYNIYNQGLNLLSGLSGKSKGIATTLLLVEQGLAISQVVTSASRAIAQATANLAAVPAFIGIVPNPAYAAQAVATAKGIATTKIAAGLSIATILAQSVSKLGGNNISGGGSSSSSGGGTSAPSFNLVQGTGSNQIAEGLTSQRQPLQAYVVASNVTSAQALDRNIINDASI